MAKLSITVPMRWSDLDAFGHVNNAAMLTLLEEARIHTLWTTGEEKAAQDAAGAQGTASREGSQTGVPHGAKVLTAGGDSSSVTLVAGQRIEYLRQMEWTGEPVRVDLWIGRLGGASLDVCYEVYSAAGQLCAKAETSVVMVEVSTGAPRRLTQDERDGLSTIMDEPLTFRR